MNSLNEMVARSEQETHVLQIIFVVVSCIAFVVWIPLLVMMITEIYKDFFEWLPKQFRKKAKK